MTGRRPRATLRPTVVRARAVRAQTMEWFKACTGGEGSSDMPLAKKSAASSIAGPEVQHDSSYSKAVHDGPRPGRPLSALSPAPCAVRRQRHRLRARISRTPRTHARTHAHAWATAPRCVQEAVQPMAMQ